MSTVDAQAAEIPEVVVVGSANLDIVVPVERHPAVGETVLGGDHQLISGGKGANQAVAAARLGRPTALLARVGDDAAGIQLRRSIAEAGVNIKHLLVTEQVPSGIALISVGPDGDNSIVVSPGANNRLTPQDVADASGTFSSASVVLLQLEVPIDTVAAAADVPWGKVILNPAPATALPEGLLDSVDILVPNQTELALLAGGEVPATPQEAVQLARQLDVATVIVTMGARGAIVVDESGSEHVPAPPIIPVDTTGAGDAFCAALADGLARNLDVLSSVEWAVTVGAATCLRHGAQPSLPTIDEVQELLA